MNTVSKLLRPALATLFAASTLVAQPTCGGYVLTDADSVRVVDDQGNQTFHQNTGSYPTAYVAHTGPLLIVVDPAGTRFLDRFGNQKGAMVPKLGNQQTIAFGDTRVVVIDDNQVRIFDLQGNQIGQPIPKLGNTRQRVTVGADRVAVVDEDRVRLFDENGQPVGQPIMRDGNNPQTVIAGRDRLIVTDDDGTKIFDKNGVQKGNRIDREGTNRQTVKVDGDRVIVIDDTQTRIFDMDGQFQGAPIGKTGTARQSIQVCGNRIIVIDDNQVRVFDRNGGPVGTGVNNPPPAASRQTVETTKDRIVITDDTGTQVFDKNMNPQGDAIVKSGSDRQIVTVSDDAVVVTDQDRTRIFDKNGQQQGLDVMKTPGGNTQRVRIDGNRILVIDDDKVRVFDLAGAPVNNAIPVSYVEEYDVELFAQCFTIVDNFSTVTIYDRDGIAQGSPISVGFGIQHVQGHGDRVLVIDDNQVEVYTAQGLQVGSTVTTAGEPWAQPICWNAGSVTTYGTGCGGAQQFAFGDAILGGETTYQAFGPANALGVLSLGFAPFPAPIDLGVIGAPGCKLYSDQAIGLPITTSIEGFASFAIPMPTDDDLVGLAATTQFFLLDETANALGVVTTNAVETVIGDGI